MATTQYDKWQSEIFMFVLVVIIQSDIKNISTPMRNEVLAAVCVLYLNDVGRDTHSRL